MSDVLMPANVGTLCSKTAVLARHFIAPFSIAIPDGDKFFFWLIGLLLSGWMLSWPGLALAAFSELSGASDTEFLSPEKAFIAQVERSTPDRLSVSFAVAPGYYLYKEKFGFQSVDIALQPPALPPGISHFDETFQKNMEIYRESVRFTVNHPESKNTTWVLEVFYQGCADKGLCYPPMKLRARVKDQQIQILSNQMVVGSSASTNEHVREPPSSIAAAGAPQGLQSALQSGRWSWIVGAFFIAGLLLSFTPCVLPMLPILSSLIAGQTSGPQAAPVSRLRGLSLAASYALGMACTYTGLGVAAGLAGVGLAAYFQQSWILILFALALGVFALSMFGLFELHLPSWILQPLHRLSHQLPGGKLLGVFLMGGLSALIVSPCIAPPLAGALVFISQTGNVALGGTALFAMAMGMSVPLLLLGVSSRSWLPQSGVWMQEVKRLFGLLLLGVAIWTVQPLVSGSLVLAMWGMLMISGAVILFDRSPSSQHHVASRRLVRSCAAAILGVFGLLQIIGAASGGEDPWQPLKHWTEIRNVPSSTINHSTELQFQPIQSLTELKTALQQPGGQPVMLDFYADWCISCKQMERYTFTDTQIKSRLQAAQLLRIDVTHNTRADQELMRHFQIFGPPAYLFFDAQGQEIAPARVIGYQSKSNFLKSLDKARR
jgi:thioredoxin:protein disulfide reductase